MTNISKRRRARIYIYIQKAENLRNIFFGKWKDKKLTCPLTCLAKGTKIPSPGGGKSLENIQLGARKASQKSANLLK